MSDTPYARLDDLEAENSKLRAEVDKWEKAFRLPSQSTEEAIAHAMHLALEGAKLRAELAMLRQQALEECGRTWEMSEAVFERCIRPKGHKGSCSQGHPSVMPAARQQAEAAAPSDAEIEAWVKFYNEHTRQRVNDDPGYDQWDHARDDAVALMKRAQRPAPAAERIHVHKVTQTGEHFCETQCEERKKLQAFKDYVHQRLDEAGVPSNPSPPKHALHGCRIGDRLDWVLAAEPPAPSGIERAVKELESLKDWVQSLFMRTGSVSVPSRGSTSDVVPEIQGRIERLRAALAAEPDAQPVAVPRMSDDELRDIHVRMKRIMAESAATQPATPAAQPDAELQRLLDEFRQINDDNGWASAQTRLLEALARKVGCE